MNWTHFLMVLTGLYLLYYAGAVLLDFIGVKGKVGGADTLPELTFSEHHVPVKLSAVAESGATVAARVKKQKPTGEVLGSGGVGIAELFRLAKQDAIVYTQSVGF